MTAKFELIKQYILDNIESGTWQENDPVPSENKLAEQFEVSRMTSRRAFDELQKAGILKRVQGSGTVVASLKNQGSMFEIKDIADEIKSRGHQHSVKVICLESVTPSSHIAMQLDIPENQTVFHSVIVHYDNGVAVQLEQRYVNAKRVPDYLDQDFSQTTAHEYLSKVAPLTSADHSIEAIAPDQSVQTWLELSTPEPCLQLLRTTSSKQGVVAFANIIYPGSRYRLSGHLEFTS